MNPILVLAPLMMFLSACGDDNGNGNGDTLLTGFSGLVILAIVVWFVVRALNKRD